MLDYYKWNLNDCCIFQRLYGIKKSLKIPKCNQIRKGHTAQWPTEKGQKDKQRFTKHTHKTKDRVNELL